MFEILFLFITELYESWVQSQDKVFLIIIFEVVILLNEIGSLSYMLKIH